MIKNKIITQVKMYTKKRQNPSRFIELDFLRGFAITHMILLHVLWDLDYYKIYPLNSTIQGTNVIVQVMFFLLLGICLAITFNKKKDNPIKLYKHLLKRGLWVFSLGMFLTIITLIFMPDRPIIFGVLHCIGFCIILSIPFLKLGKLNHPIATAFIAFGIFIGAFTIQNPTIMHIIFGIHQANIWTYTIDYFPIFPWLGVCLLGISIGNILYKDNKRRFYMPDISKYLPIKTVSWLGRHSLTIYLVHQPAIVGVLTLYTFL